MATGRYLGGGPAFGLLALLAACAPAGDERGITKDETETFSAIGPDETVKFTGTEPFWGGEVSGLLLRYATPENSDGATIVVERFAGNNGLGYSGSLDGTTFDLTVTPGKCSDGMSERSYPFVATLKLGEELRQGCAWTEATSFDGPQALRTGD